MSKIIKLTQEHLEEIRREFEATISGAKIADGKISFTKTFNYINRKAVVYFTELAWTKMQTLIREFDKEVAWHGVASRGEDESKDEYYITDILVYPQEVTGVTVNTNQEKYEMWLMAQEDDIFNNIRMQGHSHVNMGTSPSSVDITHQEKILTQLEDDMFYIFMIWNKRGEKTIKIYDLAKNVLFDGNDVSVEVKNDSSGMTAFLENAKKMVQNKQTTCQSSYCNSNYIYYNNNYCSSQKSTSTLEKKETNSNKLIEKRKGKRKGKKNKNKSEYNCSNQTTLFNTNYDDMGYDSRWD